MSDLRELYQEIILDHNKSPRNFHKMENANCVIEGYNPLCGDHYTFYMQLDENGIKDISFDGAGCAISKASASVMSTLVKGKTHAKAETLFEQFHAIVTAEPGAQPPIDSSAPKLAVFGGVSEFPTRVKCAILPWHSMRSGIRGDKKAITTE